MPDTYAQKELVDLSLRYIAVDVVGMNGVYDLVISIIIEECD